MKLKIPPALQVAFFALFMWAVNKVTSFTHLNFEFQKELSRLIFALGILIIVIAVYSFKKAKTTVDPTAPEKASNLVIVGIYKISRNPMYLGMLFMLIAFALKLGNYFNIPVVILYVWYITEFQIKPEEKALTKLFGTPYLNYCSKVRRWI
tara:strand:+ start:493614 stop:494066 length:453 start_codon:yes stop_codon:yes gene_type:complete